MRRVSACVILAGALIGTAHADGDSLDDLLGPREIAVGDAMRAGATGASAIALNPADLPLSRDVVFEGGYGYRLSDQASLVGVSACDTTAAYPGCFYYDYAGTNPDLGGMSMHTHTHVGGTALAYPITPRVFLGLGAKYYHFDSDVPAMPSSSGFSFDVGTTLRLTDLVNVGVAGYNLFGNDNVEFPRAVGGGVLARPISILALSFDSRWRLDGPSGARYGGGAELFVRTSNGQTGFPIRAGAMRDNALGATYISGGLGIAAMKYGFDIAARRAISGIDETMFIASMRFYGPRERAPVIDPTE
ncbi:MAG: hypothetical protein ACM31C_29190 [Acidobacteriota bacterium]